MSSSRSAAKSKAAALSLSAPAQIINTTFIVLVCALGGYAWWPIYQDPWFIIAAVASGAVALGISLLAAKLRWRWWWQVIAIIVAYLVLGTTLGYPSALSEPALLPEALRSAALAPIRGWNDVLSLNLPLGHYQSTLALVVLAFTVIPAISFALLWRGGRWWPFSGISALSLTVLGTVLGSSALSAALVLGNFEIIAPREIFTLLGAVFLLLLWYAWRAAYARKQAITRAQNASGASLKSRTAKGSVSRSLLAVTALIIAGIAATLLAPIAVAGNARDVPRTHQEPVLVVQQELSPLSSYRAAFSDEALEQLWFSFETDAPIERISLATFSYYDGALARVLSNDSNTSAEQSFQRVPASRAGGSDAVETKVTVGDYAGIWVPLGGELLAIDFDGANRAALSDSFFYDHPRDTGVVLTSLEAGDSFTTVTRSGATSGDLSVLQPGGGNAAFSSADVPPALKEWLKMRNIASTGTGLGEAVSLLRESGYVSHALANNSDSELSWTTIYPDYTFHPSRAGHSSERIAALFQQLLNAPSGLDANGLPTVAGVGDDEQFAVAVALIAQELGFESRVVLGMRLEVPTGSPLSVCDAGQCYGKNLAVWAEVRGAGSEWIAVDASPQFERPLYQVDNTQRDPEYPSEVRPESAEQLLPPEAIPAGGNASESNTDESTDASPAFGVYLRQGAIVLAALLILFGPFLWIVFVKARRTKKRQSAQDAGSSIVGAWDDFIDFAVDRGAPPLTAATRSETADNYGELLPGSRNAHSLALAADRAVFAGTEASAPAKDLFWELLAQEKQEINNNLSLWSRLRAKISLRSLRSQPQALNPPSDTTT